MAFYNSTKTEIYNRNSHSQWNREPLHNWPKKLYKSTLLVTWANLKRLKELKLWEKTYD